MKSFFSFLLVLFLSFFLMQSPALAQATDCSIYPNSPDCASLDNDGDGQPNGSDPYPNDPTNNDSDGDGVPNNEDGQPNDPTNDTDSDGVPNNQDSLPKNPTNDTDGDGTPNNQDPFPLDSSQGGSSPSPSSSPSSSPSPGSSPPPTNPSPSGGGSGVFAWLGSIWASFSGFLKAFWDSLSKLFSILLGAIANPFGAVNSFICLLIDGIASVWPSTPENLKVGSLIASIGTAIPLVGTAVVYDIFQTAGSMLAIVLLIKLYKLIPFKMS